MLRSEFVKCGNGGVFICILILKVELFLNAL